MVVVVVVVRQLEVVEEVDPEAAVQMTHFPATAAGLERRRISG